MSSRDMRLNRVMNPAWVVAVIKEGTWVGILIYALHEGGPRLAGDRPETGAVRYRLSG